MVKNSSAKCRRHKRHRFSPWIGKIPGEEHVNPLQYSCLENPMDRKAWRLLPKGSLRFEHDWSDLAQYCKSNYIPIKLILKGTIVYLCLSLLWFMPIHLLNLSRKQCTMDVERWWLAILGISVILPTFRALVVKINLFSLTAPLKKNFFFCIG